MVVLVGGVVVGGGYATGRASSRCVVFVVVVSRFGHRRRISAGSMHLPMPSVVAILVVIVIVQSPDCAGIGRQVVCRVAGRASPRGVDELVCVGSCESVGGGCCV